MSALLTAALLFAAIHLLVSGTRLRDVLVQRMGEKAYLVLFSLLSVVSLAWLIWAYGAGRTVMLTPWPELRVLASVLMLVALLLMVLGLTTPGPTVVGGEALLQQKSGPRGVHRITRHPFLWGIAIWAAVHMAFNPDAGSLVFFGTFLLVTLAGTASIDAKRARRYGEAWQAYAARSSNLPFAAIATGRTTLSLRELGWWRPPLAVLVFVVLWRMHGPLFGIGVG